MIRYSAGARLIVVLLSRSYLHDTTTRPRLAPGRVPTLSGLLLTHYAESPRYRTWHDTATLVVRFRFAHEIEF
jgi:hypothetical protein